MNVININLYSGTNNGEIVVIPIGDIHAGEETSDLSLLKNLVAMIMEHDNYYVVLGGDYINNKIKKNHKGIFNEISPECQIALVEEILKPLAIPDKKHPYGRILCVLEGNHELNTLLEVGMSPAQVLCSSLSKYGKDKKGNGGNGLEKRYSPTECVISITTHRRGNSGSFINYTIDTTHGTGGGISLGQPLNQLAKMSHRMSGIMLYLIFHHHKPECAKKDHYVYHNGEVKREEQGLLCANSFVRNSEYAERFVYEPVNLSVPMARFYTERVQGKGKDTCLKKLQITV